MTIEIPKFKIGSKGGPKSVKNGLELAFQEKLRKTQTTNKSLNKSTASFVESSNPWRDLEIPVTNVLENIL